MEQTRFSEPFNKGNKQQIQKIPSEGQLSICLLENKDVHDVSAALLFCPLFVLGFGGALWCRVFQSGYKQMNNEFRPQPI